MTSTDRERDPIPEDFGSAEAAAEFWDSHSLADYEEYLEAVDVDVDVKRRHFEIEIDEGAFRALTTRAKEMHRSVKDLASQILSRGLASATSE